MDKSGADTCISCGEPVPEGRMVCPACEDSKREALRVFWEESEPVEMRVGIDLSKGQCIAVRGEIRHKPTPEIEEQMKEKIAKTIEENMPKDPNRMMAAVRWLDQSAAMGLIGEKE